MTTARLFEYLSGPRGEPLKVFKSASGYITHRIEEAKRHSEFPILKEAASVAKEESHDG